MGIQEKQADTLQRIMGPRAETFTEEASLLLQGQLPPGWQWVPCSANSLVATTGKPFPVYYKEFLPRNSLEGIKSLGRGSRCARALKQAEILRRHDLPTPEILCWGRGTKNEFLFSRGEKGKGFYFFLLDEFPAPPSLDSLRRKHRLLKEAGGIIGRLHGKGIIHGDLRPNNLLAYEDKEGFHFSFIDIESNKIQIPPGRSAIQKNLVQFFMIPDDLVSAVDLMRIFVEYCREFPFFTNKQEKKELLKNVLHLRRQRLARHHIKICWERRTEKTKTISGEISGKYYRHSVIDQAFKQNIALRDWFTAGKELKQDKTIAVRILTFNRQEILAKKFTAKTAWARLKSGLRKNRAHHLWLISHAFLDLNIPVPRPLGYLSVNFHSGPKENFFFCELQKESNTLLYISRKKKDLRQWLETSNLLEKIARSLGHMHNYGYSHGDPKWANIMVNEKTGEFCWIDLDGVRRHEQQFNRCFFKDVARFCVDIIECRVDKNFHDTFLKTYARARGVSPNFISGNIQPHIQKIIKRHQAQYD